MTLLFAGMAQTSVVVTGGIDLSVGPIISLSNLLASATFADNPVSAVLVVFVFAVGAFCGLINALAGFLIAGNTGRSFNEMSEPFLLPAIAAVRANILARLQMSSLSACGRRAQHCASTPGHARHHLRPRHPGDVVPL